MFPNRDKARWLNEHVFQDRPMDDEARNVDQMGRNCTYYPIISESMAKISIVQPESKDLVFFQNNDRYF